MRALLARFLPAGVVVLCLIAVGVGLYFRGQIEGAARGEAIAKAAMQERDTAIAALAAANKASEGYADELEAIRHRPVPVRVIRLCAAQKPVPVPGPAPGADEAGAAAGELPSGAGPGRDIGPDLYREAERADALAAQLRALQGWVSDVSK